MALPFKLDFMELLLVGDYLMKQMNKVKNKLILWLVLAAKISAGQGECIEESQVICGKQEDSKPFGQSYQDQIKSSTKSTSRRMAQI